MKVQELLIAALALAFCLVSCQTQPARTYGDAVQRQYGPATTIRLPEFSIGERGRFEFSVSKLERRSFPYKLEIQTTRANAGSWRPPTPFESAVLRIDIVAPSGEILASQIVQPTAWTAVGAGHYEQIFWSPAEPGIGFVSDYSVRATVIKPSRRQWDKASVVLR